MVNKLEAIIYRGQTKNSNLDWVGEIPSHWETISNKYVMHKEKRICEKWQGQDVMSLTMNGVVIRDLTNPTGKMPTTFDGYQYVYNGELLMCLFDIDVTPRCVGRVFHNGVTSPAYSCFRLHSNADLGYYYYYYLMIDHTKALLHQAKNIRHSFTEEQLGMLKVPFPPLEEQMMIGRFLDEQCGKIDCIIAETRESIEEYKKLKISIVHEAVTKGLEQNVEMKPSGYDDIGTIPVKWRIGTVKNQFEVVCGATPSEHEKNWNGEIVWITPSDMPAFGGISSGKRNLSSVGYDSCGTTLVPAGSIILSTRAPIGKICVANSSLCTNQGCKALIPKSETNTRFYAYYFFSILERLQQDGTGTTFKELSTFKLKNEPLLILPIEEQIAIAEYLDAKCKAIDDLLHEKEQIIIELDLYKKSLIYETVTGKRKVV